MENLLNIEGLDTGLTELFEAAGFLTTTALSQSSPEYVHDELSKANSMLKLVDVVPSVERITQWQQQLPRLGDAAVTEPVSTLSEPASLEEPVSTTRSTAVPKAIPLSAAFISAHNLSLESLPEFSRADENSVLPKREELAPKPLIIESKPAEVERHASEPVAREFDENRVKTFEEFQKEGGNVAPLERSAEPDLTKAPKPGTNDGISPSSKKYLRGVLHKEAGRTIVGSVAFLISQLLLFSAAVPIVFILFNREHYKWGLLTPLLLILAGVVYVAFARSVACPVCRQRQFVPKACHKHVKAHQLPVLGHMLPTALHMVLFKWFHCIFCGTSIRVKE